MAINKSQGLYVTRQSRKNNSATFFMTSHLYVPDLFKAAEKNFGSGYKKSVWFSGQQKKICTEKDVDLLTIMPPLFI